MPKVQTFTSADFSSSKLTLVQLLSEQLIAGGVNQSLRKLAACVGTSHRVLLYHFVDHDQLLRECLLYINEIVVSRLDSIDVPSPCNPHDLVKVIARASRGMNIFGSGLWFEIVAQAARTRIRLTGRSRFPAPPDPRPNHVRLDLPKRGCESWRARHWSPPGQVHPRPHSLRG